MNQVFIAGLCTFVFIYTGYANVKIDKKKMTVELSEVSRKKIKALNKKLELYEMSSFIKDIKTLYTKHGDKISGLPMALEGDFDGDMKQDQLLLMHDKVNTQIIFLSAASKKAIVVDKYPYADPRLVSHTAMGGEVQQGLNTYISLLSKKYIKLSATSKFKPRDFIQKEVFLGSTEASYIESGKLISYRGQQL